MTTQSSPLDSFRTFGDLLKYLRRREHLTQLELSITVGYSEAQIGRLEKNQRKPDLTAIKALFIPALHIENEPKLLEQFLLLAENSRQEDAPTEGVSPYKGLLFFDDTDSELFFGREKLTSHLVDRVMALVSDSSTRLLAVVGASGSGKSSLVRAGLSVTLKRASWRVFVFTPGADPLKELEMQIRQNQARSKSERVLLLVDQFEEVFTLVRNESERITFVDKLIKLAQEPINRVVIVIALRADFYSHCAQYPALRNAIAAQQEYIGQMNTAELRRAIEEPAKQTGWEFEHGLIDVLLNDIGAQGTGEPEPGALPLLSHALLATWERRRGRLFTLEGYRASGGVRGAIAETAESVFTDQLDQAQQELARDVFLRLTELGEGTDDTRRRATLNELVRHSDETHQLRGILNTLAEARLITLNEDSAEVAHEALIREWQRLHEWLNQDRDGLRLHRHLTESAKEWEMMNHDSSELYRGARLAQAQEWAGENEKRLNESEREFLKASVEREFRDEMEREAQRQRELEAAKKLAETERARTKEQAHSIQQLRKRAVYLFIALAIAGILGIFAATMANQNGKLAVAAQNDSNARATAEQNAILETDKAKQEALNASVRELAGAANLNLDFDPERSILLALQAVKLTQDVGQPPLIEAQDALHRAVETSRIEMTLRGHTEPVMAVAYSPDGKQIASVSDDNTLKIWDAVTGKELLSILIGPLKPNIYWRKIDFSPDGKRIVAGSGKEAIIWDTTTGQEIAKLVGHTDEVSSAHFSPDGTRVITASIDNTARIWDAASGKELLTLNHLVPVPLLVSDAVFSPDGARIATTTGFNQGAIFIWDSSSGKELLYSNHHNDGIWSVAFSSDGKRLLTGDNNTTWRLWDISAEQNLITGFGHASLISAASFSPDEKRIVTASADGTTKIWDATTGREVMSLSGLNSRVLDAVFSPDGNHVATVNEDNTIKIWNVSSSAGTEWMNLIGHTDRVYDVAYSPNGNLIATVGVDGNAKVWDANTGEQLHSHNFGDDGIWAVVFNQNGTVIYIAGSDLKTGHFVKAWQISSGEEVFSVNMKDGIDRIALSPNGLLLATATLSHMIILDAKNGNELLSFETPNFEIGEITFSPDNNQVVASTSDGIKAWDSKTGQLIPTFTPQIKDASRVTFSPDGKLIAISGGNDALIHVLDSQTGIELYSLAGHKGTTFGVAFSPDGKYLASTSTDATVKLWKVADGASAQPLTLYGHTAAIYSARFSPDGKRIVTASRDTTARVYSLDINELVEIAKSRLTRNLTEDECRQYLHVDICPALP